MAIGNPRVIRRYKRRSSRIPGHSIALTQATINLPARPQKQKVTGHTAMDGQEHVAAQVKQQKLAAPAHALNMPPGNSGAKVLRGWVANGARPEDISGTNGCTYDMGAQLARRVLNF